MSNEAGDGFSRRERQVMDVLYRLGRATAAEVQDAMPSPPSYSAVRTHLRLLEEKGHVKHEQEGSRYVYTASVPRSRARRSALRHVVRTFFDGSVEEAVAALIDASRDRLGDAELERLAELVQDARRRGRS